MIKLPFSKSKTNSTGKYLTQEHLAKFKHGFDSLLDGKKDNVVEDGLKYRNNIKHTGDALMLLQSFSLLQGIGSTKLMRDIANEFIEEGYLDNFDVLDRQYLYDIMAVLLSRSEHYEESKKDKIHELANPTPNPEGVNPVLKRLFIVTTVE